MSDRKIPVAKLNEEAREDLAEIVARFIRLGSKSDIVTPSDIFNVAFTITSVYEGNSIANSATRKEVVELAIELIERARNRISLENEKVRMKRDSEFAKYLEDRN